MKTALVSGCSFTEGRGWPSILFPDHQIINTGKSAAGNEYIARSVIDTVANNDIDFVFILWTGIRRLDITFSKKVETDFIMFPYKGETKNNVILFSGADYTIVNGLNYDLTWQHPVVDSYFKLKYKGKDQNFLAEESSLWIMLCQDFLAQKNIKYKFSFICNPFNPPLESPSLGPIISKDSGYFPMIDWKHYIDVTPLEYVICHDQVDDDGFHPTTDGINKWAYDIQYLIKEELR